jgi:hypothetical protein
LDVLKPSVWRIVEALKEMLDTLVQSKVGAMEALCAQNACEVSITTANSKKAHRKRI